MNPAEATMGQTSNGNKRPREDDDDVEDDDEEEGGKKERIAFAHFCMSDIQDEKLKSHLLKTSRVDILRSPNVKRVL
jgi:hypothetical protein